MSAPVASMRNPAIGFPSNKPGAHAVIVTLIAADALLGPTCLAMAVGSVTKNAPFAMPFRIEKTIRTASVEEKDHMAKKVIAFNAIVESIMLIAPNWSQAYPDPRRPIAIEALKQATTPDTVEFERPMELPTYGRKKDGTYTANTPIAPEASK